jgi:hypothetical protein
MKLEEYLLAHVTTIALVIEFVCFAVCSFLLCRVKKCPLLLAFAPVVMGLLAAVLNGSNVEYLMWGNIAYSLYFLFLWYLYPTFVKR